MYNLNQIPSEAQIKKTLRKIVFGRNMYCPECLSRNVVRYHDRYRCRKCKGRFSLLSHTWLANTKLDLQLFWLLLWCWTTQIPVKQSQALTRLSEKDVRSWFDKFRTNLPDNNETLERLI
ncbi:transposase [Candidatus Nomurabacteria bacterium]|nr:transposase [Candidatus Nomurabacteria bacterium]